MDLTGLNASLDALTAQVAKQETTEGGATVFIKGFSAAIAKAVADALTADTAANQGSIDAAAAAIAAVTARQMASVDELGAALDENTPAAPPV